MTADERRAAILDILTNAPAPVSASALAGRFGVSRQLIVGDVALLRAGGASIVASARGYLLQKERDGILHQTACRHRAGDMEEELCLMVDNGCTVLDVIVEHPLYGQLTGSLQLASRYDVQQFILRSHTARPLSLLTEGVHLHTLACPSEDAFQRVLTGLAQAGFLLES